MDRAPETQVMCVNVEKWVKYFKLGLGKKKRDKPCVNCLKPAFRLILGTRKVNVWYPTILFCLVLENKKILSEMTLVIFPKVIFIC